MRCHMIGLARAVAYRNIAGEVPTILPQPVNKDSG